MAAFDQILHRPVSAVGVVGTDAVRVHPAQIPIDHDDWVMGQRQPKHFLAVRLALHGGQNDPFRVGGDRFLQRAGFVLPGVESTGIEFADPNGISAYNCRFGLNKVGILFHNETNGAFTEFCDGSITVQRKKYPYTAKLTAGANSLIGLSNNVIHLVNITIQATNYQYSYLLSVYRNPFDGNGNVAILANHLSFNQAGYGAPAFSVANNVLVVTNDSFPVAGVAAYLTVDEIGGRYQSMLK